MGNTGGHDAGEEELPRKNGQDQWGDNRMGLHRAPGEGTDVDDKGYDTAASKDGPPPAPRAKRAPRANKAAAKAEGAKGDKSVETCVVEDEDDTQEL